MAGIPINFVCLKWGTKYSADFVNKLYGMCSRNFKGFDFHCWEKYSPGNLLGDAVSSSFGSFIHSFFRCMR